jgi:hypothetical protein
MTTGNLLRSIIRNGDSKPELVTSQYSGDTCTIPTPFRKGTVEILRLAVVIVQTSHTVTEVLQLPV